MCHASDRARRFPQMEKSLEEETKDRISSRGRITFAEFMELSLYGEGGYYTEASHFARDYFTSPAAHPAFGALIAVQLQRMWELLGQPPRFTTVEMGAGNGLLARDVAGYAAKMPGGFGGALRYVTVERRGPLSSHRAESGVVHPVIASGVPLRRVVGCLLSNELVDSFPVNRFRIEQGVVREVYVTLDERGELTEALDEPSTPYIAERIERLRIDLQEGCEGEVNLSVRPWMKEVSEALEKGFVLTIDYGFGARELYVPQRARGTLQTHYRHTYGGSPYRHVGGQDITAHVDFSLVALEGDSLGIKTLGLLPQADFLRKLGFGQMLRHLKVKSLSQRERDANRMGMLELVKPEGLGGFKVLVQERGTGIECLSEMVPSGLLDDTPEVPLLRDDHVSLMEGRYPHLAWEPDMEWPPAWRVQRRSEC